MSSTHDSNNLNNNNSDDVTNVVDTSLDAGGNTGETGTGETISDETGSHGLRSLRYWLRAVDGLLARELEARFAEAGASRRDLRVLNMLSREGGLPEKWRERLERNGKRLWSLADRGWIKQTREGWQVTDAGAEARARLTAISHDVRERVEGAVSPDDLATTAESLEAMARELGWEEGMRLPRGGRGRGRGLGHGHGDGHGHGRGRGRGHGRGRGFGCGHGHGRGRGQGHGQDRGHERGFGHEHGFGSERGFGLERGFGHEHGFGREPGFGHQHSYGREHDFDRAAGRGQAQGCRCGGHSQAAEQPRGGSHHSRGRGEAFERGLSAGFSAGFAAGRTDR